MRFTYQLLTSLLLLAGLSACQRELDAVTTPPATGNGGNNGGTQADSSYMPLTTGNWWTFKDSANGSVQTQTVSSRTIAYNGRSFSALGLQPSANGIDSTYYCHDATDYRFLALSGTPSVRMEYQYLRDTVAGSTWSTNAGIVNGLAATADGEVLETNISKTILGVTYQKVIHSYLSLDYSGIGNVARYHFYSAKGVGIIAIYSDLGMPGGPQTRVAQELSAYHVN